MFEQGTPYSHNNKVSIDSFLGGLTKDSQFSNLAGELIKPGKEPEELLMRSIVGTPKQMNALLRFIAKGDRYGLGKEHADIARRWLAAQPSIGGIGRRELVQAIIGVLAPQLWGQKVKQGGLKFPIRSSNDNQQK